MIIGDFNEVLEKGEKWGGKKFNPAKAKFCAECMDNLNMMDLE